MKILLTGQPRVGKSTLLEKTLQSFPGEIFGIVAQQLLDNTGNRVGFSARNFHGQSKLIAHVSEIQSSHVVGNKYHVSLESLENFVVPELIAGLNHPDSLTVIDEIGRIQSFSKKFLETVQALLQSEVDLLGTIVLDPEPWSLAFKENPQVILIEVTQENRESLGETVTSILKSLPVLKKLSLKQNTKITELVKTYIANNQYIQIQKLFDNAIHYVTEGKVKRLDSTYRVIGKTDTHIVEPDGDTWRCDCHLFNGREMYTHKAGICSHIQSVILTQQEE